MLIESMALEDDLKKSLFHGSALEWLDIGPDKFA
jgi:hypothetical protein